MTIGERITRVRKEHGLSQEAFGETLGVSRQAISKWESDSCILDVDKLIALSRIYHVSVGYILGMEEGKQEGLEIGENADSESGEEGAGEQHPQMSEEQLRMVEEIVDRYVKAIPSENKNKRRQWMPLIVSCALIFVILAGTVFWFSINMEILRESDARLTEMIEDVRSENVNTRAGLDQIAKQQDSRKAEQDSLLAAGNCCVSDWNPTEGVVTFTISVVPRRYSKDMKVRFRAESAGDWFTVEAEEANGSFQAPLSSVLSNEITIFVQIESEGETQQQCLKEYSWMLDYSIPKEISGSVIGILHQCNEGHLISNVASMEISVSKIYEWEPAPDEMFSVRYEIEQVEGVYYINDEDYAVYEAELKENGDVFRIYQADMPIDVMLKEGDILTVVSRITDEYGRVFEWEQTRFEVRKGELAGLPE